jgi:hypothetical protein
MDKDFRGVLEILQAEYEWSSSDDTFIPSMQDFTRLRKWVCWADGLDDNGRFNGFCPLHDRARRTEGSAVYDFVKGMFWCNREESCTAPRRAMSLNNLYLELATRALA